MAGGIFRASSPGEPVEVLWPEHQAAVERRLSTGCRALPAEATVEGFAQAVDDFFQRQRGAMRG
jgi:putative heme iron utilization protein